MKIIKKSLVSPKDIDSVKQQLPILWSQPHDNIEKIYEIYENSYNLYVISE